jgi:hypothetical protein
MFKKKVVFLSFFFIVSLIKIETRVLMSPSINDWLWYSGTIEYPLDFYFYNKRLSFCWDVGMSYVSRYADIALTCKSLGLGKNLSVLFHGSDNFILNDFQPVSNNISQSNGSVYEFFPSYVFNETTCQFNLQVSKDFNYTNEKYIHTTIRCIVPVSKQSVVNIASGNMYYNTSGSAIKSKAYRNGIDFSKNIKRDKKNKAGYFRKITKDCGSSYNESVDVVSPYIQLKQVDGNDLFAIQGSYFTEKAEQLFDYKQNQVPSPYVVLNKNFAPGDLLDKNYNFLSLDDICHSYSLLVDVNSDVSYAQLVRSNGGGVVLDQFGQSYVVADTPYTIGGANSGSAFIPVYSYGPAGFFLDKSFYVDDNLGISYPLATEPNYISDINVGDLVSSAEVVYGDGFSGQINATNLSPNTVLRVISTGPYGVNNPILGSKWNRQEVEFGVPPVVVQYNQDGFPLDFGIKPDLSRLKQPYNQSLDGSQFDFYGDFLKNSLNNNNPRITILNADGTFYDPTANCALLWYQNDYSGLFNNPTDQNIINNLNDIYITTSIDAQSNKPTRASQIIYDKIEAGPTPTDCCQKVVNWVIGCVYAPIVKNVNANLAILQSQIWSLVNVGNNVVGNQSPITETSMDSMAQDPLCQDWQNYSALGERVDLYEDAVSRMSTRVVADYSLFNNGKYSSMQYNGFNQSGIGNVLFEWLVGSYFFDNSALLDLYLGLECPTADNTNDDRSYLAVGIGNGGHFVGRVGLQGFVDIESFFRFRVSSKFYLEHGFMGFEKLVPQLDGFPIFGIIPVKMDTNVAWNGGLFYLDGSLYANDFSGVTFSYQYWNKSKDSISVIAPVKLTIPNTEEIDANGNIVPNTNEQLGVNFKDVMAMSKRRSHTFGVSIFSKLMDEVFINCGASRVCMGENIPQMLDMFISVGLNY